MHKLDGHAVNPRTRALLLIATKHWLCYMVIARILSQGCVVLRRQTVYWRTSKGGVCDD